MHSGDAHIASRPGSAGGGGMHTRGAERSVRTAVYRDAVYILYCMYVVYAV